MGTTPGRSSGTCNSQASTGMSPDVSQLDYYFAKSLFDADVFADFDYWANDPNGPRQMNASFGECEENPTNPVTGPLAQDPYGTEFGDELEAVGNPILLQAAVEGRTLFSSAGDTGSGCRSWSPRGRGLATGWRSSRCRWSTSPVTAPTPSASAAPWCRSTAPATRSRRSEPARSPGPSPAAAAATSSPSPATRWGWPASTTHA